MSDASEARDMDPEVRALEIANQKAQLAVLEVEWNALDKRMQRVAVAMRAVGDRLSRLERAAGLTDDYTAGRAR